MIQQTPIVLAAALLVASCATHEDETVPMSRVPAPVLQSIRGASKGAALHDIERGDEDGVPAYETSWQAGGHKHEIAVAEDGKVLSLEEIIELREAPAAVRKTILAESAGGALKELEKVEEGGKHFYEADIRSGNGKSVIKVGADGRVLEREQEHDGD